MSLFSLCSPPLGKKVKPTLPDNYEDDTWATLRAAVVAIHTSQPISTSLEELYKMCDNLCAHKLRSDGACRGGWLEFWMNCIEKRGRGVVA